MNFKQFQETKKFVSAEIVEKKHNVYDAIERDIRGAYIYVDVLYIEVMKDGNCCLILHNNDYTTCHPYPTSFEDMENLLFEFAQEEGYA